eukprot:TRINITY_DN10619_c0_g1_i2.p1 TRINITY_DN10619_c0_g1~~TRINITY_DN10619_c0_g1_i2.p1  ORF type:complete len:242 (+),score=44.28 TRINITY_DN10619_c0_g1_i2:87-728(+)
MCIRDSINAEYMGIISSRGSEKMSTKSVLEKILSQPIEQLARASKIPTNRESLRLYREVLKFCKKIDWNNKDGVPWSTLLAKSARREFDLARDESDPVIIMKMILTSREAMARTQDKMNEAFHRLNTHIDETRIDQMNPSKIDMEKFFSQKQRVSSLTFSKAFACTYCENTIYCVYVFYSHPVHFCTLSISWSYQQVSTSVEDDVFSLSLIHI